MHGLGPFFVSRAGAGLGTPKIKDGCLAMDEFEARLAAAYDAWHASRGRTPERFFDLYADDIKLRFFDAPLGDRPRPGPFIGKPATLAYFTAIAEALEMLEGSTEAIVARHDKVVWIGRIAWRNHKTLRVVSGPKVAVWTVRDGLAVDCLDLFDSYGACWAMGPIEGVDAR